MEGEAHQRHQQAAASSRSSRKFVKPHGNLISAACFVSAQPGPAQCSEAPVLGLDAGQPLSEGSEGAQSLSEPQEEPRPLGSAELLQPI